MENNIAVAIDIGTTKIYVIVAEIDFETGAFQVKGYGTSTSKGLRKGLIIDVERTTADIKKAVQAAEKMSGITVSHACVGVSGRHIESVLSSAEIYLGEKPRIITNEDYARLIQTAKNKVVTYDSQWIKIKKQGKFYIPDEEIKIPIEYLLELKNDLSRYLNIKMTKGKYLNWSLEEIIKKEPEYLNYILSKSNQVSSELVEACNILKRRHIIS